MKTENKYYRLPILDGLELLHARQHRLNFPFHSHNTYNITLVIEQIFSTRLSDRLLKAPSGAIVITNPGEVHATYCDNKGGSSFYTFYVSPDVLTTLNKNNPVFFERKIILDEKIFKKLYSLCLHDYVDHLHVEKELLDALNQLLVKYAMAEVNNTAQTRLFQDFLQEEATEKFSLEKTAMQFGLDKYKFLRLFKQQTGLTPNNYIILKRVEKTKELLQQHDDLLHIAIKTGFYDATHLCKHFKKITGITPQAYRNAAT